eukprot:5889720-Pyramimonas_sp.AAC.2
MMDQSDAGSAGIFSRRTNQTQTPRAMLSGGGSAQFRRQEQEQGIRLNIKRLLDSAGDTQEARLPSLLPQGVFAQSP